MFHAEIYSKQSKKNYVNVFVTYFQIVAYPHVAMSIIIFSNFKYLFSK